MLHVDVREFSRPQWTLAHAFSTPAGAEERRFVFLFGMPSRLTEWLEAIVVGLFEAAGRQAAPFFAETFSAFGRAVYQDRLAGGVALARAPESALVDAIAPGSEGALIALADPAECVAALVADQNLSPAAAIRFVAGSLAALQFAAQPARRGAVLRVDRDAQASRLAQGVIAQFGLFLSDAAIAGVLASPRIAELGRRARALSPYPDEGALSDATRPLWNALVFGQSASQENVAWRRELFLGAGGGEALPEQIDLTGPARFLSYGPYIRLPAGDWSCGLRVEVEIAEPLSLLAEGVCGADISRARFLLERSGAFDLEFCLVVRNADAPVEIRLFNERATFDGTLSLHGARLRREPAIKTYPAFAAPA